ncbi:MAG: flagellin [Nitrospirae bacterium]|nr:flagellin [Nitrospirota bacterium]
MGTRINTNVGGLLATLNLNKNFSSAQLSIERLSSGLRIVRPADDVAALALSTTFRADVAGFTQSARNAADGVNLIQTADSAASTIVDTLNNIRSLALQATNGTVDSAARLSIGAEFTQLKSEVQRVISTTKYGEISLLATTNSAGGSGSAGKLAADVTLAGLKFALGPAAETLMPFVFSNGVSSVEASLRGGTTAGSSEVLQFGTMTSVSAAKSVITAVDSAIRSMSMFRGALGGAQATLATAQSTDETTSANLQATLSQIQDVDFATEVANFTSKSILVQASMAFLAQSNLLQQSVLTLLG